MLFAFEADFSESCASIGFGGSWCLILGMSAVPQAVTVVS
jgi:hypothetical protein